MQVMVTGSNGFIGSALVERLLREGVKVTCLVRKTSQLHWLKDLPVRFVYGELSDSDSIIPAVEDADIIYHLAGVTKAKDSEGYFLGNYQATLNLLDASLKHGSEQQKIVFVSSQAAGGPSFDGKPITEDCEARPVSVYGQSKLMAEEAVIDFNQYRPTTVIRPPSVYGPRDKDIYVFFKQVSKGLLPLPGAGTQKVSMVHVDDLVEGIWLAGQSPKANGRLFYISGDGEYDWQTIGRLVARALNKRPLTVHIPIWLVDVVSCLSIGAAKMQGKPALLNRDKVREMKRVAWVCSNARAKIELGFSPKVCLEEGIAATAAWYREMGWL